ncbi:MAG TPA: hypothetical protein VL137_15285, partial [Polyangiaceae bacterium]|nr:hypothetical protein [Polyangiaceae bacterium]
MDEKSVTPRGQVTASGALTPSAQPQRAWPLVQLLSAITPGRREELISWLRVRVDPAKRIDATLQLARAIIASPQARDSALLSSESRQLLQRVAQGGGQLWVEKIPNGAEELMDLGLLFATALAEVGGTALQMPIGVLLQLRSYDGEDPRGIRALLLATNDEVRAAVATHYAGHAATRPLALALEPAWQTLSNPALLATQLQTLSSTESKLLLQIEEMGGEVNTAELLDLEREPLRLRTASGAATGRRGVGYALERRGLLIPLHPDRHVIPSEVAAIVGQHRNTERAAKRQSIVQFVLQEDHAPRRARFANSPTPLALALALFAHGEQVPLKEQVAVPRSLLTRWGARLGQEVEAVALVSALSRAAGLWDNGAVFNNAAPGNRTGEQIAQALFDIWHRGSAWNEAHPIGDAAAVGRGDRGAGAIGSLRTLVLEALHELGDDRWVPWEAIAGYVRTDARAAGLSRLVQRWGARVAVDTQPIAEIARRMVLESLHTLGVVDLGDGDDEMQDDLGVTLRITPWGRALLSKTLASASTADNARDAATQAVPAPRGVSRVSEMIDEHTLRVGDDALLAHVLALAPFAQQQAVFPALELRITSATVGDAVAQGLSAQEMSDRLARVAPLTASVRAMFERA